MTFELNCDQASFDKIAEQTTLARKENNLTMEDLAKKAEVTKNTIVFIERGKLEEISISTLNKVGIALGINFEDFY